MCGLQYYCTFNLFNALCPCISFSLILFRVFSPIHPRVLVTLSTVPHVFTRTSIDQQKGFYSPKTNSKGLSLSVFLRTNSWKISLSLCMCRYSLYIHIGTYSLAHRSSMLQASRSFSLRRYTVFRMAIRNVRKRWRDSVKSKYAKAHFVRKWILHFWRNIYIHIYTHTWKNIVEIYWHKYCSSNRRDIDRVRK